MALELKIEKEGFKILNAMRRLVRLFQENNVINCNSPYVYLFPTFQL